jgi:hypothetical protein
MTFHFLFHKTKKKDMSFYPTFCAVWFQSERRAKIFYASDPGALFRFAVSNSFTVTDDGSTVFKYKFVVLIDFDIQDRESVIRSLTEDNPDWNFFSERQKTIFGKDEIIPFTKSSLKA